MGFLRVADQHMMKPIREISVARGFNPRDHDLVCFGGAGAQHACAIARILEIEKIFIPRYAGILSACGLQMAHRTSHNMVSVQKPMEPAVIKEAMASGLRSRLQ